MSQNEPPPNVPRLATAAFITVVNVSFRLSGCFDAMVDYIYDFFHNRALRSEGIIASLDEKTKLNKYTELCEALVKKIIETDEIPKRISIELANFMFEYCASVILFSTDMALILEHHSRENVKALCQCVVLRPDGTLDRPQSILNAVGSNLAGSSSRQLAGRFCVSPAKAIQEYERRAAEGKYYPCDRVYAFLSNPLTTWKFKVTGERMEGLFYECVTIHGTTDALEYFFNESAPSHRQIALSKGAACIEHHEIAAEKILFFRRNMDPQAWRIILKRYFYKIFCTVLYNYMYKHLCIDLYREVCEELEVKTIFSCINALNTYIRCSVLEPLKMTLLLADFEPLFISLWLSIPAAYRKEIGNSIFKIYKTLLVYKKHEAVVTLIKDKEAFTARRRNQLTGCAVMFMLANDQQDSILEFIEKVSREAYDMDRIKDEVITADNFITYIAFLDCLYDVNRYDHILRFKYTTTFSVEIAKRCLICNNDANNVILKALCQGYVCPTGFEDFLYWVLDNNTVKVEKYVKSCQQPPNLLTQIYKFYMTSTRKSMYTIPAFRQSDAETQMIRKQIATDQDFLYSYCYLLLQSNNYTALPRMLTSVFARDCERGQFLSGFFLSKLGLDSVYRLLMSSAHESTYYCRFVLKVKLKKFLEFKKYWVISPRVADVLENILNGNSRDQLDKEDENDNVDPMEVGTSLDMLPHESNEAFTKIYAVNIAIYKCVLRSSFLWKGEKLLRKRLLMTV